MEPTWTTFDAVPGEAVRQMHVAGVDGPAAEFGEALGGDEIVAAEHRVVMAEGDLDRLRDQLFGRQGRMEREQADLRTADRGEVAAVVVTNDGDVVAARDDQLEQVERTLLLQVPRDVVVAADDVVRGAGIGAGRLQIFPCRFKDDGVGDCPAIEQVAHADVDVISVLMRAYAAGILPSPCVRGHRAFPAARRE